MAVKDLARFGSSVFVEMTELAQAHGAVNLGQGFPDFDGPEAIKKAAWEAMMEGQNQYARSLGARPLVEAIARHQKRHYDLSYDALTEVGVYCGASEALACSITGLLEPGDEAVLFEPHYNTYVPALVMADARANVVTLHWPDFAVDFEAVEQAITPRTKLLLLNTPHNPTGKVFTRDELESFAALARRHDLIVISDEVYEHLVFDGREHLPIATLEGMRDRTLTVSTFGKTFAMTGWKIGWMTGPEHLVKAAQTVHLYDSFCVAAPLQHGVAYALDTLGDDYLAQVQRDYHARRDHLLTSLRSIGLKVPAPEGAYYLLADFSDHFEGTSLEFARHLVEKAGVVGIPPESFYTVRPEAGSKLLRFAFCKTLDTLQEARSRLYAAYGVA